MSRCSFRIFVVHGIVREVKSQSVNQSVSVSQPVSHISISQSVTVSLSVSQLVSPASQSGSQPVLKNFESTSVLLVRDDQTLSNANGVIKVLFVSI